MRSSISPIIFGLSPHSPKMAAALQAFDLCSRQEEEGHTHNFPLLIRKRKHGYYHYHHYHLQQMSVHISEAARNFSALWYRHATQEKAIDSATQRCLPYSKCYSSPQTIRAYPSLHAPRLAGFDTFLYA